MSFAHLGDYNQAKEIERVLLLSKINVQYIDIQLNDYGNPSDQSKLDTQMQELNPKVLHFFGEQGLSAIKNSNYLQQQ